MKQDKQFNKIDALSRKILAIVEEDSDFAMSLNICKKIDDDNVQAYTIHCGMSTQIVDAIYVDLREQIDAGQYNLFNELYEMLTTLKEQIDEQGLDTSENVAPITLH